MKNIIIITLSLLCGTMKAQVNQNRLSFEFGYGVNSYSMGKLNEFYIDSYPTAIDAFLGRSISTVGREVYRNCAAGEYLAVEAHKKALKRQAYSHASKAKIIRNHY